MRGPIPDKSRDRPTVPHVAPLIAAYYNTPGNEAGGSLHIVLDDSNLADDHIAYCRERASARGDADGERLATLLLAMTLTQRRKAIRLGHSLHAKHETVSLNP